MTRFRIPPRLAPSPAAEEPGQQNAVARLKSSREVQSRLLDEQRGHVSVERGEPEPAYPSASTLEAERIPGAATEEERPAQSLAEPAAKIAKVKLVILYRLPLQFEPDVVAIADQNAVTAGYVLRALAREGRKQMRALTGEADVALLTAALARPEISAASFRVIGDPMTVYIQPDALKAMHRAATDPWHILPRATVVGHYFTAIVARLIKTRREG